MDAYTGKYYVQGGEEQSATILLLKDKLSIGLRDEHGNPRIVYWPYEQIIKDKFWKRGHAIVRCGTYPIQTIEVDVKEFADKLEETLKENERSWLGRFMNKNQRRMIRMLSVFIVILVSAYIWVVPFLAERLANKVPVSYEERLGDGMYNALREGFKIDATKTAYINDFFRELNIGSKYNIRITVVNENVANAFAIPGGNIVVYDKILMGMNGYEDLAALLSHEFTHVDQKHTTRSLFRQMASSLFLSIILGDVGTLGNVIISNADDLKGLSYSRRLEKEADMNGLKLDGNVATIGITDYAQRELGDIVYVEVETIGKPLKAGEVFGTVEAVKTVSDLFLPVDGTITELNAALANSPESVNSDPYGEGWMVKMTVNNPSDVEALMDATAYETQVA